VEPATDIIIASEIMKNAIEPSERLLNERSSIPCPPDGPQFIVEREILFTSTGFFNLQSVTFSHPVFGLALGVGARAEDHERKSARGHLPP
jgi:hypothetical protein